MTETETEVGASLRCEAVDMAKVRVLSVKRKAQSAFAASPLRRDWLR